MKEITEYYYSENLTYSLLQGMKEEGRSAEYAHNFFIGHYGMTFLYDQFKIIRYNQYKSKKGEIKSIHYRIWNGKRFIPYNP